jgi:hypothetical protein
MVGRTKMINPMDAAKSLAEYSSESEFTDWLNFIDGDTSKLESELESTEPHAYVLCCVIQGMTKEDIISEWKEQYDNN